MSNDKASLKRIIIGCSIAAAVVVVGIIVLGVWVYRRMVRQLAGQAGIIKPLGLGETGRPTAEDIEMGDQLPAYEGPQAHVAPTHVETPAGAAPIVPGDKKRAG